MEISLECGWFRNHGVIGVTNISDVLPVLLCKGIMEHVWCQEGVLVGNLVVKEEWFSEYRVWVLLLRRNDAVRLGFSKSFDVSGKPWRQKVVRECCRSGDHP
jgi:hypothetical protein